MCRDGQKFYITTTTTIADRLPKEPEWVVRGGGQDENTYFVSVGRDVPPKGVQFSESVWDGGIFHCTKFLGRGSNIPVWKGVPACLERGC